MRKIDVIADVHGRFDKLESLMGQLGYVKEGVGFRAPEGRTAVFVGDLIDTKPGHPFPGGVRQTLRAVRMMQENGDAHVVMGNHEFNAICYHTDDGHGDGLRKRNKRNRRTHQGTLDDFVERADEWENEWMPWMKSLPFWLELDGLRIIHACWHDDHFGALEGRTLNDPEFLRLCSDETTPEGKAIEALLKGVEVPLPTPHSFMDHTGTERYKFRARWWETPGDEVTCRDLVFPASSEIAEIPVDPEAHELFSPYPADVPPVFFGHYFKPAEDHPGPEAANVGCLDHSAAIGGPLVAYTWKGESEINPKHYVAVS